jgi:hypothetical protein
MDGFDAAFFFESRTPHPWAKISGNLGRRAEITLAVFFPFLTGQVGRMANAGRFVLFFRVCSSHLGWESIDAAAMICRPELAASRRRSARRGWSGMERRFSACAQTRLESDRGRNGSRAAMSITDRSSGLAPARAVAARAVRRDGAGSSNSNAKRSTAPCPPGAEILRLRPVVIY